MRKLALTFFLLGSLLPAQALGQSGTRELEQQWTLAGRPAVKLLVRETGWYRVGMAALARAGLSADADVRSLQLFADGREVPVLVRNGGIEFYGVARDTPTTDTRTYWLVVGSEPGRRLEVIQASALRGGAARSFRFTLVHRPRTNYLLPVKNGDAENFVGPFVSAKPVVQTLTVHNLAGTRSSSALEVTFRGLGTAQHRVKVAVNGTDVGVAGFEGAGLAVARFSLPAGTVKGGANAVTLTAVGGERDFSYVKTIRLTYSRAYRAYAGSARFTVRGGQRIRVSGFPTRNVTLLDVTSWTNVRLLRPRVVRGRDGFAVVTRAPVDSRRLLAVASHKMKRPAAIVRDEPSTWHHANRGADVVIISHRDFLGAVAPLRALRESQGLRVAVVDVEDLYDEFAFGVHTPMAIRDFLARAKILWRPAPRFVLLLGDASFDPRGHIAGSDRDLVPTKLVDTDYMETVSDDWLADFDGDLLPELAVGRLPARTPAEAAAMVNKVVRYETAPLQGGKSFLSVSDTYRDFDFEAAARTALPLIPASYSVQVANRSTGPTDQAVRTRLLQSLHQGPTIVDFTGHGSTQIWTGAGLLDSKDARSLRNTERLSLYLMMSCLNAYFVSTVESLGEALLRADGGAVAVWASSGLTIPIEHPTMNNAALKLLFNDHSLTIGEAMRRAKGAVTDVDVRKTWVLLGDPTTKLR